MNKAFIPCVSLHLMRKPYNIYVSNSSTYIRKKKEKNHTKLNVIDDY